MELADGSVSEIDIWVLCGKTEAPECGIGMLSSTNECIMARNDVVRNSHQLLGETARLIGSILAGGRV